MNYKLYPQPNYLIGTTFKRYNLPLSFSQALHTTNNTLDVIANRQLLANSLNIDLNNFIYANQTHSTNIQIVTSKDKGRGTLDKHDAIPNCDGLISFEPNLVLGVFTADCTPILFYHPTKTCYGAIHAGWRSSVDNIILSLVNILNEKQIPLNELNFIFAPSISQNSFEVKDDVINQLTNLPINTTNIYYKKHLSFYLDVQRLSYDLLIHYGANPNHITLNNIDTYYSPLHFSHRAKRDTGRNYHFITTK